MLETRQQEGVRKIQKAHPAVTRRGKTCKFRLSNNCGPTLRTPRGEKEWAPTHTADLKIPRGWDGQDGVNGKING